MMLRSLDTVIAFAAAMLLLSLLVTMLVQVVVALFHLRGHGLRWGLQILLAQLLPSMARRQVVQIARAILGHPSVAPGGALSLWFRRATALRPAEVVRLLEELAFPEACAAEIDDARRAVAAADQVARYLVSAKGDAESARQELDAAKKALSVARDEAFPLRVEAEKRSVEMKAAAHRLGTADEGEGGKAATAADVAAAARGLAQASSLLDDVQAQLRKADDQENRRSAQVKVANARYEGAVRASEQAQHACDAAERDAQHALARAAAAAESWAARSRRPVLGTETRAALIRSLASRVAKAILAAEAPAEGNDRPAARGLTLAADVGAWFDTVMDRTTGRFIFHTRLIGTSFALILAAGLQIDSFEVLRRLWSDGAARERVVAAADDALRTAGKSLSDDPVAGAPASEALRRLREKGSPSLPGLPAGLSKSEEGRQWLRQTLQGQPEAAQKAAVAEYDRLFDEVARENLDRVIARYSDVEERLTSGTFSFIRFGWKAVPPERLPIKLAGVLATAILLSLGAPFWFDLLKRLMSLRPVVAGKIEKESKSA